MVQGWEVGKQWMCSLGAALWSTCRFLEGVVFIIVSRITGDEGKEQRAPDVEQGPGLDKQ